VDDEADDEFILVAAAEVLWAQLGADHADESLGGADVNPKCCRRIHCWKVGVLSLDDAEDMPQIAVAVVEPGDDDNGDEMLDSVAVARATCP
jgi:hypothetical protein